MNPTSSSSASSSIRQGAPRASASTPRRESWKVIGTTIAAVIPRALNHSTDVARSSRSASSMTTLRRSSAARPSAPWPNGMTRFGSSSSKRSSESARSSSMRARSSATHTPTSLASMSVAAARAISRSTVATSSDESTRRFSLRSAPVLDTERDGGATRPGLRWGRATRTSRAREHSDASSRQEATPRAPGGRRGRWRLVAPGRLLGPRAALRHGAGRAQAECRACSCRSPSHRHAEALHIEIDDRRRVERQQLAQQEATDDGDAERATKLGARARPERQRQRAQERGHRRHENGPEPPETRLVDGVPGAEAVVALEVERDVDHHDRVFLHDPDEQDDSDHRDDREVHPADQQREQRTDAGRRQGGQDRERVDQALVEDAQDDVDRDQRRQDEQRLVGERGLEGLRRARELPAG